MSAAALEAFRKDIEDTLPHRTTIDQSRRTNRDPIVDDEDTMLS